MEIVYVIAVIFLALGIFIARVMFPSKKNRSVEEIPHGELVQVAFAIKIEKTWYILIEEKDENIKMYYGICGDTLEEDDRIYKGAYRVLKTDLGFWKSVVHNYGQYRVEFFRV